MASISLFQLCLYLVYIIHADINKSRPIAEEKIAMPTSVLENKMIALIGNFQLINNEIKAMKTRPKPIQKK